MFHATAAEYFILNIKYILSRNIWLPILWSQIKSSTVHVGEITGINFEIGASIVIWVIPLFGVSFSNRTKIKEALPV